MAVSVVLARIDCRRRFIWLALYCGRTHLTLPDKIRIGWGMLQLLRTSTEDDQPLMPWLKRHRQNARTIERFWGVVLISALNESLERLGLKYARKVFVDGFLRDRHGFDVSIPTVPLARLYGDELQQWFAGHSVKIETGVGVAGFDFAGDEATGVRLRDGRTLTADWYISAVPFDRLLQLLPEDVVARHSCFGNLRHLEVSPITSVHLWYDRSVMDLPHLVLVDCLGQWIFNRGGRYLQVVVSASQSLHRLGKDEIERRIVAEISHLLPRTAGAIIQRSKVVSERSATFSVLPGVDCWRPTQETPLRNLVIAGDWTGTGWPATMEGAVRSGYLAAEVIRQRT